MAIQPAAVLVILCLFSSALAFSYDLPMSTTFCFTEELLKGTIVRSSFSATLDPSYVMDITVQIRGPDNDVIYSADGISVDPKRFLFTAASDGDYQCCISNRLVQSMRGAHDSVRRVTVDMKFDTDADSEEPSFLDKQVNVYQWEFNRIGRTLQSIMKEFAALKKSDAVMSADADTMKARIRWFSVLVVFILVGSGTMQAFVLSSFFKKKKIV
ncbi:emp24/gp25L/p24 family [Carpediemonas membranifera]|uniref:Emp24/gp25L/p24 family n=1 Tax=Carpediemonas membranifera TaxID=201153 RepID=A0A8J6E2N1_9EUKA|nr:emp24/gp25L/p24 family [Carpediemonas membranifera]|eukprot:KAG9394883.1 emp24/gp25L/p24 family [Carpediemonas membranifera]